MPELPEVETMRRGVEPVVGGRITAVDLPRCRKRPIGITPGIAQLRRRTVGIAITGTDRVGKRVVVVLESGDRLVFEPRMTGLVLIGEPPTAEHLRLRFALAPGPVEQLLFWDRRGLGSVRLVDPEEFAQRYGLDKLGPDALAIKAEVMRERLRQSRRAIKVALLDQAAVAGIGNLYASEILHCSGIHPALRCDALRRDQWIELHASMGEILRQAIRYEGSTLADGTYRNALNQSGGYQNHHRVYDKANEMCRRCGKGRIARIVQAQRSTFFCPVCQPVGRRARASTGR